MNAQQWQSIVREAMALSGAAAPALLEPDAPTLGDEPVAGPDGIYLVGLIGGKEVGKSALVNALAGAKITQETSHGPGTQLAVAYVHADARASLEAILDEAVPGKYRVVVHHQETLARQVLLDLPDIDSRHSQHLAITRSLLRHMLYPIWIQSVEKYADDQPRKLLVRVAEGNDPKNFLFCLNKADQLGDAQQAAELREDYAARLAAALPMTQPPRVFLIAATQPGKFDWPQLAELLSRQKPAGVVADARQLARQRRDRSLLAWLGRLDLPRRAQALARLDDHASELLAQRLGVPLLEGAIPRIHADPAYRALISRDVFARRASRWPIVNILDVAISPLANLVARNAAAFDATGPAALVDAHLKADELGTMVQSSFAQLHQEDPAIAGLYRDRKLWEPMDAQAAAARLRRQWVQGLQAQRDMVLDQLAQRRGVLAPVFRFLLTIGAVIWFAFVQPALAIFLGGGSVIGSARQALVWIVQTISTEGLLKNAIFLLLWHLGIWAILRWHTRRQVDRLLVRWQSADQTQPTLSLGLQTLQWINELESPVSQARNQVQNLCRRIDELKRELGNGQN